MVPSPARGHGDRWERWGRKASPVTTATTRTPEASAGFGYATGLSCRECGQVYELGPLYACGECFGPLEVCYDYPRLDRSAIEAGPQNMWRYAALLPVPPDIAGRPTLQPGYTRLVRADNLAHALGMRRLWIKDDRGNPTHSFKDRVVAVALAAATELGFKVLACPSTGNLANAVAAAAARAGIRSVVLVPADLELQKIITTSVYGGTFVTVDGTYDDVNRLASELAGEHEDWAFVNVNVRPYYAEGSKTLGFEIAEQLGWRLPDQVVVPIASGAQLVKVDKGFSELASLGLVPEQPWRVFGAQASGCAPVSAAFAAGTTSSGRSGRTPSPSRWPSATRPTGRTRWTWCGAPAARSPTSATTRSSTRCGCSPRPRAFSARPRAGSPSACCASCSPTASSTRRPRR